MKSKVLFVLFLLLFFLLTACAASAPAAETTVPETIPATVPEPTTEAVTVPTEPETVPTVPLPVVELTEEEKTMLLKIGMAERGNAGCTECIALVMRTVLNRVEADRFGSSVRSVILAPEQFTPVMDGSYIPPSPMNAAMRLWTW